MKNRRANNRILWICTISVTMLVFVCVLFLMRFVQKILNEDVQINLTEVVTQNNATISSKLMLEVNNLQNNAIRVEDRLKLEKNINDETFEKVISEFCADIEDTNYFLSNREGHAVDGLGNHIQISGRGYFQLAIADIKNISERIVSRINGEEIFVISVAIKINDKIIGTLQKPYTTSQMYSLCSLSLFSGQGSMYIINADGYILIAANNEDYNQELDNYYRSLYLLGNQEASKKLEEAIGNNQSGFLQTTIDGKKYFSTYTPIEDLYDWYLITSIAVSAVSPNASSVIDMFYFILLFIVVAFASIVFGFLKYKRRQQQKLDSIAFVDTVTKGNTYYKFVLEVTQQLLQNSNKTYGFLSLDLDKFKYINSFYGFDRGDKVLQLLHKTISQRLLPDEILARVSGDKFVVLLTEVSTQRVISLVDIDDIDEIKVSISAGLYLVTDPKLSLNLMVDKASTAMESVKGALNNKLAIYSDDFERVALHNEQLKQEIERAIENKEFSPFYQPKVDTLSGELVGAEVLARWNTDDGVFISPSEFIPLCEKTGQIVELDFLIFEKTLHFFKKELEEGKQCVPVSVNFSRMHLVDPLFVDKIVEMMDKYNIPRHLIQIELTESVFFENQKEIQLFVDKLHSQGLLICIDDFGSGYSSLNMLKDVSVDVLKIDKGFLDETENIERQRLILAAIAAMAEKLNIHVIVEGVETLKHVKLMQELGLYVAQGYYYYKPMAEEQFALLCRKDKL